MTFDEITVVLVCDDVRKEITGKQTLIGVFTGDILLNTFPSSFGVAFWLEITPTKLGEDKIDLRISLTGKDPVRMGLKLDVTEFSTFGVPLPTFQILADEECELFLEMLEGETWRVLRKKKIRRGDVPQEFTFASASPPPA